MPVVGNGNDSGDIPLEELVNIKVTSVEKKETSLENSPAAVTVVTADDIRRFGVTTLPDALRMVPGMDVARVNSHEWAISSRGFWVLLPHSVSHDRLERRRACALGARSGTARPRRANPPGGG